MTHTSKMVRQSFGQHFNRKTNNHGTQRLADQTDQRYAGTQLINRSVTVRTSTIELIQLQACKLHCTQSPSSHHGAACLLHGRWHSALICSTQHDSYIITPPSLFISGHIQFRYHQPPNRHWNNQTGSPVTFSQLCIMSSPHLPSWSIIYTDCTGCVI